MNLVMKSIILFVNRGIKTKDTNLKKLLDHQIYMFCFFFGTFFVQVL